MWQGERTSLIDIYNDLISIYAQLGDIHEKFLALDWESFHGPNKDKLPDWALEETDEIRGKMGELIDNLWRMKEVKSPDTEELNSHEE